MGIVFFQPTKKAPEPEPVPIHTPPSSPEPKEQPQVESTSLQQPSSEDSDKQSKITDAVPSVNIPEISVESPTTVDSKEYSKEARYDLRSNHTYQDLRKGASALLEEQKEHIVKVSASTPGGKRESSSSSTNLSSRARRSARLAARRKQTNKKTLLPTREITQLLNDAKGIVGKVNKAAKEVLADSRAQIQQGKDLLAEAKQYKKLEQFLNRKLGERPERIPIIFKGKKRELTVAQARELRNVARSKINFYKLSGKQLSFDGTLSSAISHGVMSGSKILGKRIDRLPSNVGDTFGAHAGNALARMLMKNSFDFDTVQSEVGDAVVETAKEVPLSIAKEVTFKTCKGVLKEIAPKIAKKIPGLGTISTAYHVAKAVSQAETPGQAGVLGAVALTDATLNFGCMAAGQMLIPIPVVGAAIGAAAGTVLTKAFHDKLTSQK